MANTTLSNLINPEVMADMISAKIDDAIVVTPFAKIDNTLTGIPGNSITVPQYAYIGDAADVAEGADVGESQLTATDVQYTVKKAAKGVTLTDEALLSAYGNPVGETNSQLAKAIASKMDGDSISALLGASNDFNGTSVETGISYAGIVDAIDLFEEELNTAKVIFVHPSQITALRKDANFISADKYGVGTNVVMNGEVGKIANCSVVPSRRVPLYTTTDGVYIKVASGASGAKLVVTTGSGSGGAAGSGEVLLATVKAAKNYPSDVKADDGYYVAKLGQTAFLNPIVKIETDARTEDEVAALTIYKKRAVSVESERDTHHKTTYISADAHYVAALTNASKVVLAAFRG